MDTAALLKKVRAIEIRSRGLTRHIFSGEYHSAFRGRGMAFSEVREYQYGDEIRNIDWNVTARMRHPYVKVFEEERELTVMLLIDVSGSSEFGTQGQRKIELITEIAAVLAFSAIQINDKVGVVFFTDSIEKFIPPKKGSTHILRIIRELIGFKPQRSGTNLKEPLRFVSNAIKKRCTAFIISDFIDSGYEDALKIAARKHDLAALKINDIRENEVPDCGLIRIQDAESNREIWIDSSDRELRRTFEYRRKRAEAELIRSVRAAGVDMVQFNTGEDYIRPLIRLFKMRGTRL